jgi:hypothetical protein
MSSIEFKCDLGEREKLVVVEVAYDFTPGEPMVRYYPDGSGYPGSGPEIEVWAYRVISISGRDVPVHHRAWANAVVKAAIERSKYLTEKVEEEIAESESDRAFRGDDRDWDDIDD